MIFDKIENLFNYSEILPPLKEVRQQIEEFFKNAKNIESIDLGRKDLSKDVYINVIEYQPNSLAESRFETHENYVDIQILLQGKERFYTADTSLLTLVEPYSKETDCAFLIGEPQTSLLLSPEFFVIAFQSDAHIPSVKFIENEENETVKKAVIKVKYKLK